ncbi:MAG: hypothetical protein PHF74_08550 [Dehalococcoidales bacterium]|nr:hypothetical protein [Dehalococcoidales bacterium]
MVKTNKVNNQVKQHGHLKAVNRMSFEVEKGEIFGLPAGKTTLRRCTLTSIKPTSLLM